MTLGHHFPDGYYDKNGEWQRTKFCFVFCGSSCTCMPPGGQHYSAAHDTRKGADRGIPDGLTGGGCAIEQQARDGVHVPMEGAEPAAEGTECDRREVNGSPADV